MSDSIADLLASKRFAEPPEISIIKSFVEKHFKHTPEVTIRQDQIVIGVPNAALAGTLRMHLHELQEMCETKKRLVIRIG